MHDPLDDGDEVDGSISADEEEALGYQLVVVVPETDLHVHGVALHAEFGCVYLFDGSASVLVGHHPLVGELGEELLGVLVHAGPFVQGICGQTYTSTFCGFVNVGDKERIEGIKCG